METALSLVYLYIVLDRPNLNEALGSALPGLPIPMLTPSYLCSPPSAAVTGSTDGPNPLPCLGKG